MSTDYTCLIPLVPWVITTRFIFQNLFIERSGYQQIRLLAPGFTRLVIWRVFSKNAYCTFTSFASWCVIDRPLGHKKWAAQKCPGYPIRWHNLDMFFFKSCGQLVLQSKRSSHHYQTLGFRNSTFFPSYRPKVLMDEDDEISSVATDDTTGYPSVRLVI